MAFKETNKERPIQETIKEREFKETNKRRPLNQDHRGQNIESQCTSRPLAHTQQPGDWHLSFKVQPPERVAETSDDRHPFAFLATPPFPFAFLLLNIFFLLALFLSTCLYFFLILWYCLLIIKIWTQSFCLSVSFEYFVTRSLGQAVSQSLR